MGLILLLLGTKHGLLMMMGENAEKQTKIIMQELDYLTGGIATNIGANTFFRYSL